MAQEKENVYHEALVILSGMGIKSNNKVMMPNGVAITVQEYLKEKLRYGENLPGTTDKIMVENLQEQFNTAKKELIEEIESIEKYLDKYLDKYGMSSYGANTRQAYLEGLKKALAAIGGNDE